MVLFQDYRIPSAATVLGMSLHYITLACLIRLLYYYSVVAMEISIITPILNPSVVHIGFLMKKMTPGQVFRLSLQFLPAVIIPPMLLTHVLSQTVKIGCSSKAVYSHHTVTAGAIGCSTKGPSLALLLQLIQ
jgi:branched-subunit amino acid transport protein